ncbi:hypothetical protein HQQ81_22050 [Microbacteriaceae bacterium VKM Ac-2854]|nr:hypothetical protein [Microbacteriaceae bacterium VKM Ac-2854]
MSEQTESSDSEFLTEIAKLALAERIALIEAQPIANRAAGYGEVVDHLRGRLEEADVPR